MWSKRSTVDRIRKAVRVPLIQKHNKTLAIMYSMGIVDISQAIFLSRRIPRTITSRSGSNAIQWNGYSTDKLALLFNVASIDTLKQLADALHIPPVVTRHRYKCSGMDALGLLIARLRSANTLEMVGETLHLNWSPGMLSSLFNATVGMLVERWGTGTRINLRLLSKSSDRKQMADAVRSVVIDYTIPSVVGFIDGTVLKVCRPKENEEGAYNGKVRSHALKFQGLVLPNGMISIMDGPFVGAVHDAAMYSLSKIAGRLGDILGDEEFIFGDSAYGLDDVTLTMYKSQRGTPFKELWNKTFSKVRISVEWPFGQILTLFPFLQRKQLMRLLQSAVGDFYLVATLLFNCFTCIYRKNIVSTYFQMTPPTLESYLDTVRLACLD